jgi:hypothetical protein
MEKLPDYLFDKRVYERMIVQYHHPVFDFKETNFDYCPDEDTKENYFKDIFSEFKEDIQNFFSLEEEDYIEIKKIVRKKLVETCDEDDEETIVFLSDVEPDFDKFLVGKYQYNVYFDVFDFCINKKRKAFPIDFSSVPEKKYKSAVVSVINELKEINLDISCLYNRIQEKAVAELKEKKFKNIEDWEENNSNLQNVMQRFVQSIERIENAIESGLNTVDSSKELYNWVFKINKKTNNSFILFPFHEKVMLLLSEDENGAGIIKWNYNHSCGSKPVTWDLFKGLKNDEEKPERPIYYMKQYRGWIVSLRLKEQLLELGAKLQE